MTARATILLATIAALPCASPALARKQPACKPESYVVTKQTPIIKRPGAEVTPEFIVIKDTGTGVTGSRNPLLLTGCPDASARFKGSKNKTTVVATYPNCPGVKGTIRLHATISKDCATWKGSVKVPGQKPKKSKFTALRSACSDGIVDPTREQCDGPNTCPNGGTCDASCHCTAGLGGTTTTTTTPTTTTRRTTTTTTSTTTTTTNPCGNGRIDTGEECDGSALGSLVCPPGSPPQGFVFCNNDCTANFGNCNPECVQGTVGPNGGTVRTAHFADGATTADPLQVSVTTPSGPKTIMMCILLPSRPIPGFQLLGREALVTVEGAPAGQGVGR